MMSRCYRKKDNAYHNYGGRGITVAEEWHTPANFMRDMESTHKPGLSLDRIDNNKGYSKENCRWATMTEQQNNTRRNHLFEFKGMKKTLTNWAKELGMKRSTLAQRIYVYGWSVDKALTGKAGY